MPHLCKHLIKSVASIDQARFEIDLKSFQNFFSTVVDGRTCNDALSFVWSRLSAPAELSTRYTTADIVLEIDSTSATVEKKF